MAAGKPVEMENFFSRLTLDIIGKAVFDYDFDSLTTDDPVIKVLHRISKDPFPLCGSTAAPVPASNSSSPVCAPGPTEVAP